MFKGFLDLWSKRRRGVSAIPLLCAPLLLGETGDVRVDSWGRLSAAGRGSIAEGSRPLGTLVSADTDLGVEIRPAAAGAAAWVCGVRFEDWSFCPSLDAPLPKRLTAVSLTLGYVQALDRQWTLHVEAAPGYYGEARSSGSADYLVPGRLMVGWAPSERCQWIFGLQRVPHGAYGVVPLAGLSWQLAPKWVLRLMLPAPQIEYELSPRQTVFAGASLHGGVFHLADDGVRRRGRPELNDQYIEYREVSAAAGIRWRWSAATSFSLSAGWLFNRRFTIPTRDLMFNGHGAASFQAAVAGRY